MDTRFTQKIISPHTHEYKRTEKEIRETTFFTIAKSNIKCLVDTLTKKVKDVYDRKFKTLKKETEEDIKNWFDLPRL